MTIVEFITARLDAREELLRMMAEPGRHYAAEARRELADIAAKRAIVDVYRHTLSEVPPKDPYQEGMVRGWRDGLDVAVRHLASVYSDHADYRSEWRP